MPPAADGNTLAMTPSAEDSGASKLRRACRIAQCWPSSPQAVALADDAQAQALSDLLPVLICGEASAEQAFGRAVRALSTRLPAAMVQALRSIEDDERRHGRVLAELCASLPPPRSQRPGRAAARFVRQIQQHDPARHLANIAALDAAVCRVLAGVCQPGRPLACNRALRAVFDGIRRDEARHVRISRRTAMHLGLGADVLGHARRAVGEAFAALLLPQASAFARLGVDEFELRLRLKASARVASTDADDGIEPDAIAS